jgi:hypothetical protein
MNRHIDVGNTRMHSFRGVVRPGDNVEPNLRKQLEDLLRTMAWLDFKKGQQTKSNAVYLACLALADLIGEPEGGVPFEEHAGPFAFAVLEQSDGHDIALGNWKQAARYLGVKALLRELNVAEADRSSEGSVF